MLWRVFCCACTLPNHFRMLRCNGFFYYLNNIVSYSYLARSEESNQMIAWVLEAKECYEREFTPFALFIWALPLWHQYAMSFTGQLPQHYNCHTDLSMHFTGKKKKKGKKKGIVNFGGWRSFRLLCVYGIWIKGCLLLPWASYSDSHWSLWTIILLISIIFFPLNPHLWRLHYLNFFPTGSIFWTLYFIFCDFGGHFPFPAYLSGQCTELTWCRAIQIPHACTGHVSTPMPHCFNPAGSFPMLRQGKDPAVCNFILHPCEHCACFEVYRLQSDGDCYFGVGIATKSKMNLSQNHFYISSNFKPSSAHLS